MQSRIPLFPGVGERCLYSKNGAERLRNSPSSIPTFAAASVNKC